MAAARFSRNLILLSTAIHTPPPRFFTCRSQSNKSSNPIEYHLELESVAGTDLDHLLALRRIESAMRQILVRKSTPGWLPFVPGCSFWVPPPSSQKPHTVAEVVEKLANSLKKMKRPRHLLERREGGPL